MGKYKIYTNGYIKFNIHLKVYIFVITYLLVFFLHSQELDYNYYDNQYLRYYNHIYDENTFTVQLYKSGWENSYPIIRLNTNDKLELHFDCFSDEIEDLYYQIIHCNRNWKKSNIKYFEYIEGFDNGYFSEYEYSITRKQKYIHYTLSLPNSDIKFLKSGNYLLKVYNNKTNQIKLTRRFIVTENVITIISKIKRSSNTLYKNRKQEIDFLINLNNISIEDINEENFKIGIMKNQNWKNIRYISKPSFIQDKTLTYDYIDELTFDGGNEFRYFDIKNFTYNALETKYIDILGDTIKVYLKDDFSRPKQIYVNNIDINGKFLIHIDDVSNSKIEAEYALVNFYLSIDKPYVNGDIYIYGELSNWQFNKKYKLKWNSKIKKYEKQLYLKQGYYNYLYAYLRDFNKKIDFSEIEGNHSSTNNEYTFIVYYKGSQNYYDRIIGVYTVDFP